MAITLRSSRELDLMAEAASLVVEVLLKLKEKAKVGVTTGELDEIAFEMTRRAGAEALFRGVKSPYKGVKPFPGAICSSLNEQVVHGIPSKSVRLSEGDILSVDFGVKYGGYCGDAAISMPIGKVSQAKQRLMDVTKDVLDIAVERMSPGVKWSSIAGEMEETVNQAGFSVVTDYVGHGIGKEMHEDPKVPNFVSRELLRSDIILKEGMVFAVEPMVNMGKSAVRVCRDGWTIVTRDSKPSVHFEHTIAVVQGGSRVLTKGL